MLSLEEKDLCRNQIVRNGYTHIAPDKYRYTSDLCDFAEFSQHWNNLVKDEYLHDNGGYRYRRCGMFSFENGVLEEIAVKGWYYQCPVLNKTNGGQTRKFGPLEESFVKTPIVAETICTLFDTLPLSPRDREKKWRVYVHPFRIIARSDSKGEASPEGPHRDGHQYTAQIFVHKDKVTGATSHIYESDMTLIKKNNFSEFLETVIIDDERMFHDVSSLETMPGFESGYRDIFTINFNLFDRPLASIME